MSVSDKVNDSRREISDDSDRGIARTFADGHVRSRQEPRMTPPRAPRCGERPAIAVFHVANHWTLGTPLMDACDMTDRDRSLTWRVAATLGSMLVTALGYFLSVLKPPEQMNAQAMLPPQPFPPGRDEYRP